jgi:N-methylhydantoinase A
VLLGVDVGGTFTDAALVARGRLFSAKRPTTPEDQSVGVIDAVEAALADAGASAEDVDAFAHGMTVATNALLEGRGARAALMATEGFTDLVELGRQARPHLYRLEIGHPAPLVGEELRFAVPERMGPHGPLVALEPAAAQAVIERLAASAPESVAVVLLHSYADPSHERLLGELISQRLPDVHVSLSHQVVGTFREYERAATTEADAALSPLLARYLDRLSERAREAGLPAPVIMQSSGGVTDAAQAAAHASLTVLSGPAGGAGGARMLAAEAGESDVLCLDMGGTSCDVCVIEGEEIRESAERTIGGRPLSLPTLDIHTVGAGGGSIAWRDPGGALRVGPRSAGADPGPCCYGRGGTEPTVTDANLVLGRLPRQVPLAGAMHLDADAAERAIDRLAEELGLDRIPCAEGVVRVANAEMSRALRLVTVQRGIDPRRFALLAFGGAGPLHAAALAEELGIERILCPLASGVLSAVGLAAAAPRRDASRTVMRSGAGLDGAGIEGDISELLADALSALGQPPDRDRVRLEVRYRGQAFELGIDCPRPPAPHEIRSRFEAEHERRYGYRDEQADLELVTIRASVWGASPELPPLVPGSAQRAQEVAPETTRVVYDGCELETALWHGAPPAATEVAGPAVFALGDATLVVPPGWRAQRTSDAAIGLRRDPSPASDDGGPR